MRIPRASLSTAAFSAVINLLMLTGPLFMLQVYDRVLTSASVPTLVGLVAIVAVLYAFMALLDWICARLLARSARIWDEDISQTLFHSVVTGDHGLQPSARIFSPLRDLDTVRSLLAGPGPRTLFDIPWVPIYLGIIFMLHSMLGWFSVGAALILIALMVGARYATKNRQAEASALQEAAHAVAQEARGQADLVKAVALYDGLSHKWEQMHVRGLALQQTASDRAGLFSGMTKSSRLFAQAGVLAIGAALVIQHEVSAGAIIAASIILSRGLAPIEQLIGQWQSFTAGYAAWQRLKPFAAMRDSAKTKLPAPQGYLSVIDLTCFVPGSPDPILSDVNFTLEPGEILGITGPSGVGKSTLLKAILGIWPHAKSEVRLDGATLEQWDRKELARHLGYVPQDIVLFSGTIAQNISRFLPDASAEQIVAAAQLAQAHDMILKMPLGYDTLVGPKGIAISSGQRQRIALASALYGRPRLIVLDEPNSNLDELGEQALSNALATMRNTGSTIIIASHRPSALANVDKLLALRDGRQVALGTKDRVKKIAHGVRFEVVSGAGASP
jgi:PrtD family type I secretion system ABC transporter